MVLGKVDDYGRIQILLPYQHNIHSLCLTHFTLSNVTLAAIYYRSFIRDVLSPLLALT